MRGAYRQGRKHTWTQVHGDTKTQGHREIRVAGFAQVTSSVAVIEGEGHKNASIQGPRNTGAHASHRSMRQNDVWYKKTVARDVAWFGAEPGLDRKRIPFKVGTRPPYRRYIVPG